MDSIVQQRVALVLEYTVAFTRGVFELANDVLAGVVKSREPTRAHRFVAFVDGNVAAAWPGLPDDIAAYARHHALELLGVELVVGGEAGKTEHVLAEVQRKLAGLRIDRHSYVVAIGGGAMLDVVGFAAATVHRGVRLVRVPTTVLAQNDAGVGVKNGINAFGAKNFLGAFAAPYAVIDDSRFLATLDPRDRVAGMAEAVKVSLVRDAAFFAWLSGHADALARFELDTVEHMIRRCAELHLAHIAAGGDPFELGNARPLDFGHWAAHKLELLTAHALRHGEAVAIGMALDTCYSTRVGLLAERDRDAILALLRRLGLPTWDDALADPALLGGLADFREHLGGELCITLLSGIGRPVDTREVRDELVGEAIAVLRASVIR